MARHARGAVTEFNGLDAARSPGSSGRASRPQVSPEPASAAAARQRIRSRHPSRPRPNRAPSPDVGRPTAAPSASSPPTATNHSSKVILHPAQLALRTVGWRARTMTSGPTERKSASSKTRCLTESPSPTFPQMVYSPTPSSCSALRLHRLKPLNDKVK